MSILEWRTSLYSEWTMYLRTRMRSLAAQKLHIVLPRKHFVVQQITNWTIFDPNILYSIQFVPQVSTVNRVRWSGIDNPLIVIELTF